MYSRILVPLDGSKLSERALGPATSMARRCGARLVLLRVPVATELLVAASAASAYGALYTEGSLKDAHNTARSYLNDIATQLATDDLAVQTRVIEGDVAATILDVAHHEQVDLIVMSTHGYSGFTRWMLGSITERVLQHSPCPVMAIHGEEAIERIMVPLDGSLLAEKALGFAEHLAGCFGAELLLMHAVTQVDMVSVMSMEELEHGLGAETQAALRDEASAYLDGVVTRLKAGLPRVSGTLLSGPAAGCIIEAADANDVDLVVMSTHGRTGFGRWIYGSITEKVLRSMPCSMLVIRPPAGDPGS